MCSYSTWCWLQLGSIHANICCVLGAPWWWCAGLVRRWNIVPGVWLGEQIYVLLHSTEVCNSHSQDCTNWLCKAILQQLFCCRANLTVSSRHSCYGVIHKKSACMYVISSYCVVEKVELDPNFCQSPPVVQDPCCVNTLSSFRWMRKAAFLHTERKSFWMLLM